MRRKGIDMDALDAALRKFRQLEREIGQIQGQDGLRRDLMHTRSKLGIFLDEALPREIWDEGWAKLNRPR